MAFAFPFTAIVGQDDMKLALLMTALDQKIGGVLIFGDRGTGKSTAVRGLAALLPPIRVREGDRFNLDPDRPGEAGPEAPRKGARPGRIVPMPTPVVDLPLNASEDRVCGALDIERALTKGEKAFEPGLFARAHRGFLYIDEVNLLEDHLVDLLLDVAASGTNVVEREGLSVRHPSRFVLVGSGNPEEGELRPQLLDRFGLAVDISASRNIKERMEVVRRREAFERDPQGFCAAYEKEANAIRRRLKKASTMLDGMETPDDVLELCAVLCMRLGVDGMRGELTLMRASRAKAALEGRAHVTRADVIAVAPMVLRHRLRRDPLDETGSTTRVERALVDVTSTPDGHAGRA
ncbi:MAG: magnesium chelatase ATPase subunit I [Rhizobiaceae bacterium]|jgi:magnesium chelatase subunit I|nr:magnesium chelatase ATPase subunit I [Rhizobiaceae bacterium]